MDTKQGGREMAQTGDGREGRRKAPVGQGLQALAIVAVVAVIAATIWTVLPGDGSSGRPQVAPSPVASSTIPNSVEETDRVYLWDPATGDVSVVFSTRFKPRNPELSPDGKTLVYERYTSDGTPQIYMLGDDGTEQRLTFLPGGASDPTWSPDGKSIAFAASLRDGGDVDIFVMNAVGNHIRRLVGTSANDDHPDWSPDGTRIAFHSLDETSDAIWLASLPAGRLTRLTPRGIFQGMDPAWSPDGRWIAYSRFWRGNTANGRVYSAELWRMRSDGTDKHRVTRPDKNSVNENPSWSPDGRMIVFERHIWNGERNRVVVINATTGRELPVLSRSQAVLSLAGLLAGVAPSWSREGILLSLHSGNPAPSPGRVSREFRVVPGIDDPGIDAIFTMTRSTCELSAGHALIHPGKLKLEFIQKTLQLEGLFRLVKLRRGRTVSDLEAHHFGPGFGARTASLDPWTSQLWSNRVGSGRWAVLCYKDTMPMPNGINFRWIGAAGPIRVGVR